MKIALVSAKGAPGVTTLACALGAVWPSTRSVVVVECDPWGADIGARFAMPTDPGMTSLVLSFRHQLPDKGMIDEHVQELPGGLAVLLGPTGADAAMAIDRELHAASGSHLADLGGDRDVVFDCGRFLLQASGQARILDVADQVVLVARPDPPSVVHGQGAIEQICELRRHHPAPPLAIVVGKGRFEADDVADSLGVELLGVVPWDTDAASIIRGEPGSPRALSRSPLLRSVAALATALVPKLTMDRLRDAS